MILSGDRRGRAPGDPKIARHPLRPGGAEVVSPRGSAESFAGCAARPARDILPISQALRLSVQRPARGVSVVRVLGEIDLASLPRLDDLISQRLTAAALHTVVLDLSEVTFVGCAGLELLLAAQRRAELRGISLCLVTGSRCVDRLLDLTGLADRFTLRESVAEAIAEYTT